MKPFLVLCCVAMLFISGSGYVYADTNQTTNAESSHVVTVESPPATGEILTSLSNNVPEVTLPLDSGIYQVSFQAAEAQKLKFNESCGQSGDGFSEIILNGPYNGSFAFSIPKTGECTITMSGTGSWTAQVAKYNLNNPLNVPINLTGSGISVSPPFTLEKGEYIFQREETKTDSPMYELTFANGSFLMDSTNTYVEPYFGRFSPDTFKILTIPEPGTFFLSIINMEDNPKPWNASIIKLPPAPVMGPGPSVHETV